MSDSLVCPSCGSDRFTAVLITRTRYVYNIVPDYGGLYEVESEEVDAGDLGDIDTLECDCCGADIYEDDAITQEAYDADDAIDILPAAR